MNGSHRSSHRLVASILLLSLCLQGCVNSPISVIPNAKQTTASTKELTKQNPIKQLVGREFAAEKDHIVTFHEQEGQLRADVTIHGTENSKKPTVFKSLPVRVAKDIDLHQIPRLNTEEQKRVIHFNFPKNGHPGHVLVFREGLLGGMNKDDQPGSSQSKKKKGKGKADTDQDGGDEDENKKRLTQLSQNGDDRSLISHGEDRKYWYSVSDGLRLLIGVRKEKLKPIDIPDREGEKYTAHRENRERVFIADPYHVDNFNIYFRDDIATITGQNTSVNHGWQHMPRIIVIPILYGLHWRCIRIEVNYESKECSVLYDDPYGIGHFPAQEKQKLLEIIREHLKVLMSRELGTEVAEVDVKEYEKQIDQQGSHMNSFDCGPIVFNNIKDYSRSSTGNEVYAAALGDEDDVYSLNPADKAKHENKIIQIRAADVTKSLKLEEIEISSSRLEDIKKAIKRSSESKLKQLCKIQYTTGIVEKISELHPDYVEMFFSILEQKRSLGEGENYTDKELAECYRLLLGEVETDKVHLGKDSQNRDSVKHTPSAGKGSFGKTFTSEQPSYASNPTLQKLQEINQYIEDIQNLFSQQEELADSTVLHIKENLLRISWRVSEIPSYDKFHMVAYFPERNWLLLDHLSDALNSPYLASPQRLKAAVLSLSEDLTKIKEAIPVIDKIITTQKLEEGKKRVKLTHLDNLVSFFMDTVLLGKMHNAINTVVFQVNREGLESFVQDEENKRSLFRALEIIGECAKYISSELKELYRIIPWLSLDSQVKGNPLTTIRNKFHHDRDKIELVLKYEPDFLKPLVVDLILFLKQEMGKILPERDSAIKKLQDNEFQSLNSSLITKMSDPISLPSIAQISIGSHNGAASKEDTTLTKPRETLETILDILDKATSDLSGWRIRELLSYIKEDDNTVYKLLLKRIALPETENAFIESVTPFFDNEKIHKLGLSSEDIEAKFRSAYPKLKGKRISEKELEEAFKEGLRGKSVRTIEEIKNGIREVILDGKECRADKFREDFLRPIFFRGMGQEQGEQKFERLRATVSTNMSEAAVNDLFNFNEETKQKIEEEAVKKLQASNAILDRLQDISKASNLSKGDISQLIGLTQKERDTLFSILSKGPRKELDEETIKKDIIKKLNIKNINSEKAIREKIEKFCNLTGVQLEEEHKKQIINSVLKKEKKDKNNELTKQLLDKPGSIEGYKKRNQEELIKNQRSEGEILQAQQILSSIPKTKEKFKDHRTEIEGRIKAILCRRIDMVDSHTFDLFLQTGCYPPITIDHIKAKYKNLATSSSDLEESLNSILAQIEEHKTPVSYLQEVVNHECLLLSGMPDVDKDHFQESVEEVGFIYEDFKHLFIKKENHELTQDDIEKALRFIDSKLKEEKNKSDKANNILKEEVSRLTNTSDINKVQFQKSVEAAGFNYKNFEQLFTKKENNELTQGDIAETLEFIDKCQSHREKSKNRKVEILKEEVRYLISLSEESFKKLVEKAGYCYESQFQKLVKKAGLAYKDFEHLVTKKENNELTQDDIEKVFSLIDSKLNEEKLKHKESSVLITLKEKVEQLIPLSEESFKRSLEKEGYFYIPKFQKIYRKITDRSKKQPLLKHLKEGLLHSIQKLNSIFVELAKVDLSKERRAILKMSAEYLIEEIGPIAEKLVNNPDYIESRCLSTSRRNLYLIAMCRKATAHYPLGIDENLADYLIDQLVLDTKARINKGSQELKASKEDLEFKKTQQITSENLEKREVDIHAIVEGLGFKGNFKLFGKAFGCDIGVQGDLNLLVEYDTLQGNEKDHEKLIELEIRLSKELNGDVRVYTADTLRDRLKLKVGTSHLDALEESAVYTLEDVIRGYKYLKIFKEDRWSTFTLSDNRVLTRSDYLEGQDLEKLFSFLFNDTILCTELQEKLSNRQVLYNAILAKLQAYNASPTEYAKDLAEFFRILYSQILLYENKIKPIRIPFEKKGNQFDYVFLNLNPAGYCRFEVPMSPQKAFPKNKIDNIEECAEKASNLIWNNKDRIHDILSFYLTIKDENENIFKAFSVQCAYDQKSLNERAQNIKVFRQKRLKGNPELWEIINNKAKLYLKEIFGALNRHNTEERGLILDLLYIEKKIDQVLKEHFEKNQAEITYLWQIMDQTQTQMLAEIRKACPSFLSQIISCFEDFKVYTINNVGYIENENVKAEITKLQHKKEQILKKFSCVFQREKHGQLTASRGRILSTQAIQPANNKLIHNLKKSSDPHQIYSDYSLIFKRITDPEIIKSLRIAESKKEDTQELIARDFEKQYCKHSSFSLFINDRTLCDISSEVEYAFYQSRLAKKEKLEEVVRKSSKYVPDCLKKIIKEGKGKNLDRCTTILGFPNSEVQNIYQQIVFGCTQRQFEIPQLLTENLPSFVYNNFVTSVGTCAETQSTSIFRTDIRNLEHLMEVHKWPDWKKITYPRSNFVSATRGTTSRVLKKS